MPRITAKGSVHLSDEQRGAVSTLAKLPKQVQTLGGYAGTGKTTVIAELIKKLEGFGVCAFTGKAANVLRRKGIPASTIHSLIYTPNVIERRIGGRMVKQVEFNLKDQNDLELEGFIVDEASMVDAILYDDLRFFERPIIFVGDHGQLEPVRGNFNLMEKPDVTLETIHRNAGEIARFASFLRSGNRARDWKSSAVGRSKQVFLTEWDTMGEHPDPDQMVCAFNDTRVALNKCFRNALELPADRPVVGDRVMCLQNDASVGVFNGMQGEIVRIDDKWLTFRSDGQEYVTRYVPEQFNALRRIENRRERGVLPFDYAYVVTAHKAQGDEWDHVMVAEQRCRHWDHARWTYTAASRARKRLTWVLEARRPRPR